MPGRSSRWVNRAFSSIYIATVQAVWRVRLDDLFDRNFYCERYPDVVEAGFDPLFHYLRWGAAEDRFPNAGFNSAFYLRKYPDVAASRLNPLIHYLRFGRTEGRLTRPSAVIDGGWPASPGSDPAAGLINPDLATNPLSRPARVRRNFGFRTRTLSLRFSSSIDEPVELPTGETCLSGWCFFDDGIPPRRVLARAGKLTYPAFLRQPRPDVCRTMSDSRVMETGFVVRLPPAAKRLQIVLEALLDENSTVVLGKIRLPEAHREAVSVRPFQKYADYVMDDTSRGGAVAIPSPEAGPSISILVPTYNTNLYYLSRCLDSVRSQTYPNWELCIADDRSDEEAVHEYLRDLAGADSRVRLSFRPVRGHISAALNTAFQSASGQYVIFLDHDDELHPHALAELAAALKENPRLRLVYTDEDKIDYYGRRSEPAFKPDFDMDVLRSFDYLGHIACLRRSLFEEIGGFRDECTGAQDWDLLLRAVEELPIDEIGHVSRPLYHWRKHEFSTAASVDAKPYVRHAWRRVVQQHAIRAGIDGLAEPGMFDGSMRLRHRVPDTCQVLLLLPSGVNISEHVLCSPGSPLCVAFARVEQNAIAVRQHSGTERTYTSLGDIPAHILLIVTRPILNTNHFFLEELVVNALQPDCTIVAPVIVSSDARIVDGGFFVDSDARPQNIFSGMPLNANGYLGLARVPHRAALVSGICLAGLISYFRNDQILSILRGGNAEDELARLSLLYACDGHPPLITPYAIATLAEPYGEATRPAPGDLVPVIQRAVASATPLPRVNPNIELFSDGCALFRQGIE